MKTYSNILYIKIAVLNLYISNISCTSCVLINIINKSHKSSYKSLIKEIND